jgi:hypothetical protein
MSKVYCSECKHHKEYYPPAGFGVSHECKKVKYSFEDFLSKHTENGDCIIINKNNDCPAFERKISIFSKMKKLLNRKIECQEVNNAD